MFYELIKSGAVVRIERRKIDGYNYDPAMFFWYDNKLYAWGPSWGSFAREDLSADKLEKHLQNMIAEGFTVRIVKSDKPVKKALADLDPLFVEYTREAI